MENLGAYADPIPFGLEDSREPPEVISGRSLGQAADALTTPRGPQFHVPQFHPQSHPWSARSSFGQLFENPDTVDGLSFPGSISTTAEHDSATFEPRDPPLGSRSVALAQRQNTAQVEPVLSETPPNTMSSSASPLRGENRNHSLSPPLERLAFRSDSFKFSPAPVPQQQPHDAGMQSPTSDNAHDTPLIDFDWSPPRAQQLARVYPILTPEVRVRVDHSAPAPEPGETLLDESESQPRFPGRHPTRDEDFHLPQWVKTAASYLLCLAKCMVLDIIPFVAIALWRAFKYIALILLSTLHFLFFVAIPKAFVALRELSSRASQWLKHGWSALPPARPNPDEPPAQEHTAEDPPAPARTPAAPPPTRSQCAHCGADYPASEIICCPRKHSICSDCMSSHVGQQATRDAVGIEIVCLHPSGCGLSFQHAELDKLPAGVVWQLFRLFPTSRAFFGQTRGKVEGPTLEVEPEVKVEDEGDEDQDEEDRGQVSALLCGGMYTRARIEDAISRCTVSLRRDRLKRESSLASISTHSYQDRSDSNSDVDAYSQSVSALTRLRRAQNYGATTPGPSTPTRGSLGTPTQRRRTPFATAPPQDSLRQPETPIRHRAVSFQPVASQPDVDPKLEALRAILKRRRMDRDNAQSRLRTAKKAFQREECERTQRKVDLETRLREEAGERVMEAERAFREYEMRRERDRLDVN